MRRTDELLYQMIPRTIADRLRAGEPAVETCQVRNVWPGETIFIYEVIIGLQ